MKTETQLHNALKEKGRPSFTKKLNLVF